MARKNKEDTLKTVTAILDAAEDVFIANGVAKSTISQIAEQAGVSKGAVYGHYEDKIDVCVAVCVRQMNDLDQVLTLKPGEPPLETLMRWGLDYTGRFLGHSSFRKVGEILYVKCQNSPEFEPIQKIRAIWERKMFRATSAMLNKAVESGDLPKETDLFVTNIYLHSLISGLISSYYYSESKSITPANSREVTSKVLGMALRPLLEKKAA